MVAICAFIVGTCIGRPDGAPAASGREAKPHNSRHTRPARPCAPGSGWRGQRGCGRIDHTYECADHNDNGRHVDQSQKFHEHAVHGRHCSRHSPETLQRGFRHRLGQFLAVRRNSQPTQRNNTIQSHCISFGDDSSSVPKSRRTNRFFVSLDCGVWRGWHQGAGGRRRHCHRQYCSSCSRVWSGV